MSEIKDEQFSYSIPAHHYKGLKKERQFEAVIDYEYTDHGQQEIKYIALPPELFKHLLPVLGAEIEKAAMLNRRVVSSVFWWVFPRLLVRAVPASFVLTRVSRGPVPALVGCLGYWYWRCRQGCILRASRLQPRRGHMWQHEVDVS